MHLGAVCVCAHRCAGACSCKRLPAGTPITPIMSSCDLRLSRTVSLLLQAKSRCVIWAAGGSWPVRNVPVLRGPVLTDAEGPALRVCLALPATALESRENLGSFFGVRHCDPALAGIPQQAASFLLKLPEQGFSLHKVPDLAGHG